MGKAILFLYLTYRNYCSLAHKLALDVLCVRFTHSIPIHLLEYYSIYASLRKGALWRYALHFGLIGISRALRVTRIGIVQFQCSTLPHLKLQRNRSSRVRRMFSLLLISTCTSTTFAQDIDVQDPHPIVQIAVGGFSALEYRDILLSRHAAATMGIAVSARGFSLSIWNGSTDGHGRVTETLLAYSHKLPVVDLHVGIAACSTSMVRISCRNTGRLSLTTNNSHSTVVEATIDEALSGSGHITSASIVRNLGQLGSVEWSARASAHQWRLANESANGGSVRLIGVKRLNNGPDIHFNLGYVDSQITRSTTVGSRGASAGITFLWQLK